MSRRLATLAPPVMASFLAHFRLLSAALTVLWLTIAPCQAQVTPSSLFSDNMMLQANADARIFGHALPGERVRVQFAGQIKRTKANNCGLWSISLGKLRAGTRGDLLIIGTNTIKIKNVLVGEIWLCAGQSNITLPVKECTSASSVMHHYSNPEIRFLKIEPGMANAPKKEIFEKWQVCNKASLPEFSAIGALLAHDLHNELHQPIGIIQTAYGGSSIKTWVSANLANANKFKKELAIAANSPTAFMQFAIDKDEKERALQSDKSRKPSRLFNQPLVPCSLFNAMIAPLTAYSIKGVVWYQGEADADDAALYARLFPALIADWRHQFNQGDFPFVYVQLPGFEHQQSCNPGKESWARLRDAQAQALKVPVTEMVVSIDQGDPVCLHPKNKIMVAQRLARSIMEQAYGGTDATAPTLQKATREGGKVLCQFNHGRGLQAAGRVRGFELCGSNRLWRPAQATLRGNTVVLQSKECRRPVGVRYAWANYPKCNLYSAGNNARKLPAAPFCVDLSTK